MALTPILGAPEEHSTNMVINGITLRPGQEIYPVASQLPQYSVVNPVNGNVDSRSWPLAFRAEQGTLTLGRGNDFAMGPWFYTWENYCYINGMLLANYLAGTNSAGQAVTWPAFPGSSSAGFLGKYTPRQIDNVVAQIVSLGSKAISADYPYPLSSDYPGVTVTPPSEDVKISGGGGVLEQKGCRFNVSPFIFPGWLSKQWVIGMGRSPKVNRLLLEVTTFGSQGTVGQPGYIEPKAQVDVWVECWLPAAYQGGREVIPPQGARRSFGTRFNGGALNCSDLQRADGSPFPFKSAQLKKADGTKSFWANQILTSDQGIDFQANPKSHNDPDQGLAAAYHDPYAFSSGTYKGTGSLAGDVASPLLMSYMQLDVPPQEWYPGELRCIRSRFGSSGYSLSMRTGADGSTLRLRGGVAVRSQIFSGWFSDPDPVPLESIRGFNDTEVGSSEMLTGEPWSTPSGPGGPGATLRDRHIASVIPVSIDIGVPASGGLTGPTVSYFAWTDDPLVNKFPGDWKNSPTPSGTMQFGAASPTQFSSYDETAFRSSLTDPDSYWMPQADCAVSTKAELASQTLIPRSARMPNIGYLQYIRTGVIPDDESQDVRPAAWNAIPASQLRPLHGFRQSKNDFCREPTLSRLGAARFAVRALDAHSVRRFVPSGHQPCP